MVATRPRPRQVAQRVQARRIDRHHDEVARGIARPEMRARIRQATIDVTQPADQIDRPDQSGDERERPIGLMAARREPAWRRR